MQKPSVENLMMLTIPQAAQFTNMSQYKIRKAISEGKLMAFRHGNIIRIEREELDSFMQGDTNEKTS